MAPQPAGAGQQGPESMGGEELAQVVRHTRAALEHSAARYEALDLPPDRLGSGRRQQGAASALRGR
ncbi:hypothetical protein [Kitasatospora sp. NPDC050463]|uniref:hypothetical protein n=1 Tax=Kitasatospora sp. NPDC050463 TaxID=3155786 RepID=UPI0033F94B08